MTTKRKASFRMGLLRVSLAGMGCLAIIALAILVYAISAFLWAWIIMLILGSLHVNWPHHDTGFWHVLVPWGLVAPFVLG